MASELSWRSSATGSTVYATVRSSAGRTYWNGSALETLTVANWGNYDIAMPETPASSYFYVGDWPAALTTVGWYYVDVYLQAGASPAISDGILGTMLGYWNGTTFAPESTNVAQVAGTAQTAGDIISAIGAIGSGTGAALNFACTTDSGETDPLNGVTKVGTVPTTTEYLKTTADNGIYEVITAAGSAVDWVYKFSVGSGRVASKVTFNGYLLVGAPATGKSVNVYAYNWTGTPGWDLVSVIAGQTTTTDITRDITLLSAHTGTGTNAGVIYLRFTNSGNVTSLNVDELVAQAQNLGQTIGYADGSVWVDTTSGIAGTTPYVNGTADKPVLTWADALTIASAVGIKSFHLLPGTSIQLTASCDKYRFIGSAIIDLNGQSIADALFKDAYTISGTSTGDGAEFINCGIETATIAHGYFIDCRFKGTLTFAASNDYIIIRGSDTVVGSSNTATFVFAANVDAIFRDWRGGIQLNSMASTNTAIIDGAGRVVISDTSVGGSITIRGHFPTIAGGAGLHTVAEFVAHGGTVTQTTRYSTDQNHGVDWSNVSSPASTLALTNTTINSSQKVDIDTIKTKAVAVDAGGTTFPSGTIAKAGDKMDLLDTIMEDA